MDTKLALRPITDSVDDLKHYWQTYDQQEGYQHYSQRTLLDDALYGLGIAIDPTLYYGPEGYERFKAFLRAHLEVK